MKRLIIFMADIFAVAALGAQNLDPTVEVSRVYEGKLIEVRKPAIEMAVPDTLYRFDLDFDYSVFDKTYRGSYEFNPYMLDMRPEANPKDFSKFYMKAGAGYTLHPTFDLLWSPVFQKPLTLNVYGTHRSYVGGYRALMGNEAFSGYDLLSKAGADFGYDWKKVALDFGASYYGVAVDDLHKKRSYNAVDAYAVVGSKAMYDKQFMYSVALNYRFADDCAPVKVSEHGLSIVSTFGPSFDTNNRISFDLGLDLNAYTGGVQNTATRLYLVPHYVYEYGILDLNLGLRLSAVLISSDFKKNQFVYPDIRMNLAVIPDAMRLYMNIGGGEKLNSYASLIDRDHHVDVNYALAGPSALMQPSVERVSAELGIEGRISGFFSYNLRGGYANYAQELFDAVVKGENGLYRPLLGYSLAQKCYASLDWDMNSESLRFDGNLSYSHYWGMEPVCVKPSEFSGDVRVLYNWRKRVYAGADCDFALARTNGEDLKVPGFADLGVYAEYALSRKFSFWLRGGNLLNMEIQRNLLYAEKGINFTAGVCLNF